MCRTGWETCESHCNPSCSHSNLMEESGCKVAKTHSHGYSVDGTFAEYTASQLLYLSDRSALIRTILAVLGWLLDAYSRRSRQRCCNAHLVCGKSFCFAITLAQQRSTLSFLPLGDYDLQGNQIIKHETWSMDCNLRCRRWFRSFRYASFIRDSWSVNSNRKQVYNLLWLWDSVLLLLVRILLNTGLVFVEIWLTPLSVLDRYGSWKARTLYETWSWEVGWLCRV